MSVRPTLLCGRSVCQNSLALSCQVCHADLVLQLTRVSSIALHLTRHHCQVCHIDLALQLTCLSKLASLYDWHVITVRSVTLVLLCEWHACQTSAALWLTCHHCQFCHTGLALWLTCLSDQCRFTTNMSQQSCFITVRSVCVHVCFFFLLSLFVTLYIFLHLTVRYSCTFGKGGWVGAVCTFWYECPMVAFSLRRLACMHCVYLALWTCKVLGWSFFMRYIYNFHSFVHSFTLVLLCD